MEEKEILLNGLIDIIKFIRSMSKLGVGESKLVAERWGAVFSYGYGFESGWVVKDFLHIRILVKMVSEITKKEWIILNGNIYANHRISDGDIINL